MDEGHVWPLAPAVSLSEAKVRHGDRSVEDIVVTLYQEMRPSLLVYVYQLMGSTRDAEDVVQVAFLKVFDHLSRDAEILNLRSWLYRVVHNLAVDQVRQRTNQESLIREWLSGRETAPRPRSPEDELIRRQQIEASLGRLNDRERHCLMLRADGLSYKEIADVLGISAKSVSVYLARGLKKFEANYENRT